MAKVDVDTIAHDLKRLEKHSMRHLRDQRTKSMERSELEERNYEGKA